MAERIGVSPRPFGQPRYNVGDLRLEWLTGPAYKFSIFLPVTGKVRKRLFSFQDREKLRTLFNTDFGGCTYLEGITHPLLAGEWINEEGFVERNSHVLFEIYTKQSNQTFSFPTKKK